MNTSASIDLAAGILQTRPPSTMPAGAWWAPKKEVRAMLHGINPKRYPLKYPDTEYSERVALTPPLADGSLDRALRGEEIPELNLNFPQLPDNVPVESMPPATQPIAQEIPKPKARKKEPTILDTLPPDVLEANQLLDTPPFEPSWDLHNRERLRRSFSTISKRNPRAKTPVLDFKRELEKYHAQWAAEHEPPRPPQPGVDADSTTESMGYYDPGAESTIHADPNPGLRERSEPEPPPVSTEWYIIDANPVQIDRCPRLVPSPPRHARSSSLDRLNRHGTESPRAFAFGSPAPSSSSVVNIRPATGAASSDGAWPLTMEADCALRWAERTREVSREVEGRWR